MKDFFKSKKGRLLTFSVLGVVAVAVIVAVVVVPKFLGGGTEQLLLKRL